MGNIHTDEVDPIAEAEVYLAYGRDETAEEILKEAVIKNPAREELKLKLLEIYANRSDVRAFETLAEEMYASQGGRPSKHWPRVEELGRKLNPNNPMFKGGGASAASLKTPAPPNFAETAKMKAAPGMAAVAPAPSITAVAEAPTSIATSSGGGDFDFDMDSGSGSSAPAASQGLDFDMGGAAETKPSSVDTALDFSADDLGSTTSDSGLEVDLGQSANVVDFDFGDKSDTAMPATAAAAPETELAMDMDAAPSNGAGASSSGDSMTESPQWDETATKLDLARAYIDMGDSEGARSILDEVMSEGNDQQKSQAKELAAQL
jgi:pilus assembly protein FimV